MISDSAFPELPLLKSAESRHRFRPAPEYESLVAPTTNEYLPVHRWFRFKESFSPSLLKTILPLLRPTVGKKFRLLDPFCGVGTSLVAAQELHREGYRISATGIERNPFIAFAAKTKCEWPRIDSVSLRSLAEHFRSINYAAETRLPSLSSIQTGRCISPHVARRLVAIRDAINEHGSSPVHDALLLGLASAIESLSHTRKDGRALRLIERGRPNVGASLAQRWNSIAEDCTLLHHALGSPKIPKVKVGDGRRPLKNGVQPNSYDLIFTSPPYPNNIDYTEVYKLELWMLGLVNDPDQFLSLRRSSFRSHPTCGLEECDETFIEAIRRGHLKQVIQPLLERSRVTGEPWRERMLMGYFSDLWVTLEQCHKVLRKGGRAVFVVGNSLHGAATLPILIATDLVLGAMGARLGFTVQHTLAARPFRRRVSGNHFLRESIVILKKANG